jgi:AraC-like DNA-binding protein
MPGGGTRTFLDPDLYEAGLRHAQVEAVIVWRGKFKARLAWAELRYLQLLRCEEEAGRIAYLSLAPQLVFVTFPMLSGSTPIWDGTQLQAGEIMFHSHGERLHQSTLGPSIWNLIALDPMQLDHYSRALCATPLAAPPQGRVLRPSPRDWARLRRLHAQACRLAETKSKMLAHPEVARAIEQGLIHALVFCLTTTVTRENRGAKRHHARIMARFEEVLAEHLCQPMHMRDLCELIGVTERTLRSCCAEFLGTSPTRYVLLRRLKRAHTALRDADPGKGSVAEIAGDLGFTQLGRFAAAYREAFGESPSATLRHAPEALLTVP